MCFECRLTGLEKSGTDQLIVARHHHRKRPIARIQGRFRVQILVKSSSPGQIQRALDRAGDSVRTRKGADVSVDVDPQSML